MIMHGKHALLNFGFHDLCRFILMQHHRFLAKKATWGTFSKDVETNP